MAKGPTIEVKFTGDTKGLSNATGRVDRELEGVGKKVSGFAIGAGAAVTSMAVSAVPQLIGFGKELFALGQASEVGAKKTETVFGDSAADISAWADEVNESLGLSDEAVGTLATSMGDLLVPMGFSRAEAAELSMTTTEAAGALSAWSEGQYDASEVSAILTKAMLGEREGLKALGISISAAEVDERALAVARAEGREEITAQDKALATQALILEKSVDAQTAWTDGTMDAVKQQNELSASIADAKEGLARGLVPIVQKVIRFLTAELIPAVKRAVDTFKKNWPQIRAAVEPTMIQIREIIKSVVELATQLWEMFGDDILRIAKFTFEAARKTVEIAMKAIQGVIDLVMGILTGDWSRAWQGLLSIFSAAWSAIKMALSNALTIFKSIFSIAWGGIKSLVSSAFSGLRDVIVLAVKGYVAYLKLLPGLIVSAIGSLGSLLYNAGRALLGGLLRGMKDAAKGMFGWVGGIAGTIANLKGPPAYDKVVLEQNGRLLIEGLGKGMRDAFPAVERFAASLAPTLSASVGGGSSIPVAGRSRGSSTTVIQNYPQGVTPTRVTQLSRQYDRTQGPI
tara:strand:- start:4799 stop:6508 length:1710 start_codon:yes stop_codon:yes gene_type:complete